MSADVTLTRGEAAQLKAHPYRSGSLPTIQSRRLPAYGRELVRAQRRGFNVPWLLISLCWDLGKIFPRVVIPADVSVAEIDFRLAHGLECMVVHRDEPLRALDAAEAALLAGALRCPVFNQAIGRVTFYTDEVRTTRGLGLAHGL